MATVAGSALAVGANTILASYGGSTTFGRIVRDDCCHGYTSDRPKLQCHCERESQSRGGSRRVLDIQHRFE